MSISNNMISSCRLLILVIFFFIGQVSVFSQEEELLELKTISFEGNQAFSESVLEGVIYSQETPWWFWKFLNSFTALGAGPVYFDSSSIQIDIGALRQYYNANGFFNTSFAYEYKVDTAESEVHLLYKISEGKPSSYRNFYINGISDLPDHIGQNFSGEMLEDTSEIYNQEIVQGNIGDGISYLQNNGYMFSRFDSTIIFRDTNKYVADIHLYFTPGKRYRIDTVYVDKDGPGAPYISENLLRKLTDINSGEYYSLEKIRMSQIRLFRTGLFSTINISGVQEDTTDSKVPLKVSGHIGELNELAPEIIVNNSQSAFNIGLGASYTRKNFFGEARRMTLKTSFGVQDIFNANFKDFFNKFSLSDTTLLGYVDARVTIEQPYLFSKPIFGIWETYATVNKQARYNNTLYGSKLTFQFEMPRYTAVNMLSTFYNIEVSKEAYGIRRDSLSDKLISVIGVDFGRTTVNDILFPTGGYILSFLVEEANSLPYTISKIIDTEFSSALFYKILFTSSGYLAVDTRRNSILAGKLKAGHLQAYKGDYAGIPINRTFYSGGSNSNRGWRSNQLVPRNAPRVNEQTELGVNFKGGTFIFESSVEFRQRFLESFGVAVFSDYSNTWLSYKDFRFDGIALAAGFGLRYYTAVAPFRIDMGFRVYDPSDKTYIFNKRFWSSVEFHFGIGEAF